MVIALKLQRSNLSRLPDVKPNWLETRVHVVIS